MMLQGGQLALLKCVILKNLLPRKHMPYSLFLYKPMNYLLKLIDC